MKAIREIPTLTAEEAASLIQNGQSIGFSGFTPAGSAKVVPEAIARKAKSEHEAGRPFKIGVLTGASTGDSLDGALAEADAISFRTPYQSNKILRNKINTGSVQFFDIHLSDVAPKVRNGVLGKIDWAVIEACDVTPRGEILLTTSVGASPTYLECADKIIIELNQFHPTELRGFHDIYEPADPPFRREIPVYSAADRIGTEVVKVNPEKIVGIVTNYQKDEFGGFAPTDAITQQIGQNVAGFIASELTAGRIPSSFLPVQSGVGNIANAVLGAMGEHPDIPTFELYSEVIQDSVIRLMEQGKISFASGTSLTVSPEVLAHIYADIETFRPRMILRPQEISNNPEVIRRLGLISVNTALEIDLFGNVNSTHVLGSNIMNGIGGSGDFTRNSSTSIFTCPSQAKGGKISTIVPLVSHMDHSEHSVQVVITEQGVGDLRGKAPDERARIIVEQCAHPDYRDELRHYLDKITSGHAPQILKEAFSFHQRFLETGSMHAGLA